jgi:hypothetical protein
MHMMKNLEIFDKHSWIAKRNPGSRPSTLKARENPGSRPSTFDVCEFHLRAVTSVTRSRNTHFYFLLNYLLYFSTIFDPAGLYKITVKLAYCSFDWYGLA